MGIHSQSNANALLSLWNDNSVIISENKTHSKFHSDEFVTTQDKLICIHCGGNGYMKTSPNCYHTCLDCLGRGLLEVVESETDSVS